MNSGAASLSSRHTLGRDSEQARFASFVHPADRDFCLFRDDGIAGHDKQTTETTDRLTDGPHPTGALSYLSEVGKHAILGGQFNCTCVFALMH